jgi:molybdopterin-binding protein
MNVRKKSWCHCRCNIIEGSVSAIRSKGSIAQVSIDVGFPLSLDIGIDVVEEFGLSLGSQVFAQFKASEVIFLPATIGHDFRVSSKRC